MNTWTSYTLQDFIPFTADVYFRLLERMNETFWPLHVLTLALGAAALILALKNRGRLACLIIAPIWAFVGFAFFIQRYAELNWAGDYMGYGFFVQSILLLLIALTGTGLNNAPRKKPAAFIGTTIAFVGLIGLPLITALTSDSWNQAEVFGIHADPTAMVSFGLILILIKGWVLSFIAIFPALWLLVSGLTLTVMDASGAILLFSVLAIGMFGVVWKRIE